MNASEGGGGAPGSSFIVGDAVGRSPTRHSVAASRVHIPSSLHSPADVGPSERETPRTRLKASTNDSDGAGGAPSSGLTALTARDAPSSRVDGGAEADAAATRACCSCSTAERNAFEGPYASASALTRSVFTRGPSAGSGLADDTLLSVDSRRNDPVSAATTTE